MRDALVVTCLDRISKTGPVPSPFERLVAFDLYDGPMSGVAECSKAREAYCFDLLAWDERQERRVYSLAPVTLEEYTKLVVDLSKHEKPRWPEWWIRAAGGDVVQAGIRQAIQEVVRASGPAVYAVVSRNLLHEIELGTKINDAQKLVAFQGLRDKSMLGGGPTGASYADWIAFIRNGST